MNSCSACYVNCICNTCFYLIFFQGHCICDNDDGYRLRDTCNGYKKDWIRSLKLGVNK